MNSLAKEEYVGMEPSALQLIARERSARWEEAGLTWDYQAGPLTENPASWLTLRGPNADAFVKVWTSGDAEMEWGIDGDAHARHYDLTSVDDLRACVDDLEAALIANLQRSHLGMSGRSTGVS